VKFIFCALLLTALGAQAVGAAVSSATIEDIERLIRADMARKASEIPLKGFYFICAYGATENVQAALAAGANPNAGDVAHGYTPPLSLAAGNNTDPGVSRVLLEAGADINFVGKTFERTALHQAVLFNKNALSVAQELLKWNPDIYVVDRSYKDVFHHALSGKPIHDSATPGQFTFDGIPRNDILLLLLEASERLPYSGKEFYTKKEIGREKFFTGLLNLYMSAFEYKNRENMSPAVIDAFAKSGALAEAVGKARSMLVSQ
jgi:ankyrin repeat protein